MASVFLSYDREDAERARSVALALEKAGHSVWWDWHIKGGAQYSKAIEEALGKADAVVVLWSARSVDSAWVRDEAAAGRDSGRLVPVLIDKTQPPLGFRQYQCVDLSRWRGRGKPAQLGELISAVGPATSAPTPVDTVRKPPFRSFRIKPVLIALAFAAVIAAAIGAWKFSRPRPLPTVAVMAADSSLATRNLTSDLSIKLARLQAAKADSMRLIKPEVGSSTKADLIFETRASDSPGAMQASLALLAGKNRAILWSNDFRVEGTNRADLQQQLAVTAARVLGCALEALPAEGRRLSQEVLRLYLNGCANLGETFAHDTSGVVPILIKVTEKAPHFEPGWAKLLIAETNGYVALEFAEQKQMAPTLRKHIASARKLDPNNAEAFLAEIALQPGNAWHERMRLIDRAISNAPANVYVLSARSGLLMEVGHMSAAVEDAQRAAHIDPLSPAMRSSYIAALAYAGRTAAAQEELLEAERLWPGATTLIDTRYRLSLRYGDPADAMRLQQSGAVQSGRTRDLYLRARLDPTQENINRAVSLTWSVYQRNPEAVSELIQVLGEFGRENELYPVLLNWQKTEEIPYITDILFRPTLTGFRKDPRFMRVAARMGLIDFWHRSGRWPDFCIDPDLPYNCEAEAAKIAA